MAPHLDAGERVMRRVAAEESQAARDRVENAGRIREQIEPDPPDDNADWLEWAKSKLSPEEIYPEHFPESTNEQEEVE